MPCPRWLVPCAIAWQTACLHPASQRCDNGGVCPAGQQCVAGGAGRTCALVTCGNGRLDPDEVCDDGNNRSGDGCPADCTAPCGDGVLDPGEVCDDGNTVDGDGCAADCRSLDGRFLLSPAAVAFAADEGEAPPAAVTVSAQLSYRGDIVVFGYPPDVPQPSWLSITAESGTDHTATFRLAPTETSVAGQQSTRVRFVVRHQASTGLDTFDLPVTYDVRPSDLALQTTSTALDFTTASGGDLPLPRTVVLTFNGPGVETIQAPPWLTVTPPPAPAASPASFAIAVNTSAFPAGTSLSGDVVFATTRGQVARTATVHVSYQLLSGLPEIRFVAPYVGIAGRGGVLRVRGVGLPSADPAGVALGETALDPVRPDSSTQITVSYPPLPAGRYPVTLAPAGSAQTRAELVIVPPLSFSYQAIDAPSLRTRIVYDAERQVIYGVNRLDQQIERFAYADGRWSTVSPWSIPLLADVALTPDGRSLIAVDQGAINEISLTDGVSAPVQRVVRPDHPIFVACGGVFDAAAAANSGKLFVVSRLTTCSGDAPAYLYDVLDHSVQSMGLIYLGPVAASADGSRIYITRLNSTLMVFDALSGTTSSSHPEIRGASLTVSADASRAIAETADPYDGAFDVYDHAFGLIGKIPLGPSALISRDARRAFVYVADSAGAHLEIYDLTGARDATGFYPRIGTVALPDAANSSADSIYTPVVMTSSLDDATVFVSGDRRLLVVPVN